MWKSAALGWDTAKEETDEISDFKKCYGAIGNRGVEKFHQHFDQFREPRSIAGAAVCETTFY